MSVTTSLSTPIGELILRGDERGIAEILFASEKRKSTGVPEPLKNGVEQLTAYFAGERKEFDLTLNPAGTDFQQRVWHSLLTIPYGKTLSYKEQALKLGNLKAIRAVASANGKNPLPIVIPCHRVIGSNGTLTGYAGGIWRKKWLLEHEGALTQQSLF